MGWREEPLDPYDSVPLLRFAYSWKVDSGLLVFEEIVVPEGSTRDCRFTYLVLYILFSSSPTIWSFSCVSMWSFTAAIILIWVISVDGSEDCSRSESIG